MSPNEKKLPEGWSTLFLLIGMVMTVTWSVTAPQWVEGLNVIEVLALYGLLAGLLLAKTRFPPFLAHLFSLVYGAACVAYLGTGLLPSAFDPRQRFLELGYHINAWLWKVLHGGSSSDDLMFILFLGCLIWLLGYMAAWATFRSHRVWWAILPTAAVLFINFYWGPPSLLSFVIVYVGFMLLYFIRLNLFLQQLIWARERVRYEPEIAWDFLRYGLIFTLVVMTLAWIAPGAAASEEAATFWGRFSEPWERVQDTWNRLFFTSRYYGSAQPNAFGTSTTLSGSVRLGNRVVMDVISAGGRYWRATVYDEYTGSGWLNTDEEMDYLEPFDPDLHTPQFEMRRLITQTYLSYLPGRTQLFALADPVGINRAAKIRYNQVMGQLPRDPHPIEMANISMIYARTPLGSGESYVVVSSISTADEESLRSAGVDYPRWVTERYLQLPNSLPQRVRDLAAEITRLQNSPYDKITALESYLRRIKYNELIESPPPAQDRVDWFLFDLQEGYCDYYSSALAVMARSVGVPARVAVGYGRGEYNAEAHAYRVRDNNAHAWVEVYFPRYGWIEFEPTAAESVIARPRRPASTAAPDNSDTQGPDRDQDSLDRWQELLDEDYSGGSLPPPESKPWWGTMLWVMGGFLVVAVALGGGYWLLEEQGMISLGMVQKAYARMTRFGRALQVLPRDSFTPYEYAAELSDEVPAGRGPIRRITELFVKQQFSPQTVNEEESAAAWRDLRPSLWRRWLTRWAEKFQTPPEET